MGIFGRPLNDIDDLVNDQQEHEGTGKPEMDEETSISATKPAMRRAPIGVVDRFFGKINVAAIKLEGDLKVGDTIEIDDESEPLKFTVTSMQINKEQVESASSGDDVGIKTERQVKEGSSVYKV